MFTSFTGNTRRPRQVNLSGRKTHAFGSTGTGAGSQAAIDRAQQERAQRQRERDILKGAQVIQRIYRGYAARRRIAEVLRKEWDAAEEDSGTGQLHEISTPYTSAEESLAQLGKLVRFANIRTDDDQRRIRHYGLRQMNTHASHPISLVGPWVSRYLRLQSLVLTILYQQSKRPEIDSDVLLDYLHVLHFLTTQLPSQTAQDSSSFYFILASLVSRIGSTLERPEGGRVEGGDASTALKVALETVIVPLKHVTGYTTNAYESFGYAFLALDVMGAVSTSPASKIRGFLADVVNYKLLANVVASAIKQSGLRSRRSFENAIRKSGLHAHRDWDDVSSRLRLLGSFIYFHRHAHNFGNAEAYSAHGDFVLVVSTLLNSLPSGIVDDSYAGLGDETGSRSAPPAVEVNDFVKEQILSLVNQEGIGNLLAGSTGSQQASETEKIEEARQLANYALAVLRFFPRRGDEIRMWLYLGSSTGGIPSRKPTIRYFWEATKRSSVFSTILRDSRAAVSLLRPKDHHENATNSGSSALGSLWRPAQQEVDKAAQIADEWRVILVFVELYSFVLKVTDDEEFFSGGGSRDNALPLDEIKDLSTFLKNLGFTLYFNAADINVSEEAEASSTSLSFYNPTVLEQVEVQKKPITEPAVGGVSGLSLDYIKGLVTGLIRMVYERDSRRKFLPENHWLMTSRLDMTGFISAVVEEEEARNRLEEEEDEDANMDDEDGQDDELQLIGTGRAQQQRRIEQLQRQQRRASRRRYLQQVAPRLEILQNMPFFIPFTTRVKIFRQFVADDMTKRMSADSDWRTHQLDLLLGGRPTRFQAEIRRGHEFEDAYDQFYQLGSDLKNPIRIIFQDQFGAAEAGIDGGGVTKEFLTSVTNRAFEPSGSIDMFVTNDQHLLYPNPSALEELKESLKQAGLAPGSDVYRDEILDLLRRYEFLGRIIGKCMYEGILVDVNFAPFFLRKWALTGGSSAASKESSYRPTLNDVRDLDEGLYQGLYQLKTYAGDVEDLGLNFTVTDTIVVDANSTPKKTKAVTKDLKPDGSNIPVTNENRLVYISYMARHRLQNQPYRQTAAFLRGLSSMIDPSWLSMFNHSELQTLVSGTHTSIDINDLRRNTEYGGVYVIGDDGLEHPTVQLFWKVMKELSDGERRAVLKFVTSTPRAPLLGFATLQPKFSIRDSGQDQDRLPSTSTCVNLLKLPMYKDEETLKEKLLYSAFSGAGFDLS
ncbi:hypothetical protein M011DRAFT_470833 [Sporormia fimetaria CBS 119925]|uniref:HECT-type E3 ubiquitin transferase n=1 Tax=Sporormia fimetaria CBS 119925 TaxID=1340428 RepID=A0A6A6V2D0_9PLEO|nr:hypothetical protein M011DRAFT_470833 [Sporormia fimetaria CBS 119925]